MKFRLANRRVTRNSDGRVRDRVMPFWIALLFGNDCIGTNLTRSIQVIQTSRDLGTCTRRDRLRRRAFRT